ncbi:hypothetical protein DAI22_11g133566 [Oryza sativa Japonica Group]|nr:hypothetical protein DAI22_11g133566 [Oryza sativa Japonica Group]
MDAPVTRCWMIECSTLLGGTLIGLSFSRQLGSFCKVLNVLARKLDSRWSMAAGTRARRHGRALGVPSSSHGALAFPALQRPSAAPPVATGRHPSHHEWETPPSPRGLLPWMPPSSPACYTPPFPPRPGVALAAAAGRCSSRRYRASPLPARMGATALACLLRAPPPRLPSPDATTIARRCPRLPACPS